MKGYKFRGPSNVGFAADVLRNSRLFCCPASELNDLREADVRVGDDRGREKEIFEYGLEVGRRARHKRVCALSGTFDNHLLWSHYAEGYAGVAIEVEVDETDVIEVRYSNDFTYLSDLYRQYAPDEAAVQILGRKYKEWEYEREIRIISNLMYHRLSVPIARVILGPRASPTFIQALCRICDAHSIAVERLIIADWGMYTVGLQT